MKAASRLHRLKVRDRHRRGVFHWHGATATHGMRHLAIWEFVDGSGGKLGEHVSDGEYLAEAATDRRNRLFEAAGFALDRVTENPRGQSVTEVIPALPRARN
jgi:hypothetical protein